jgi:ComF family protein
MKHLSLKTLATVLLRSAEVFFKPSCLVCQSSSFQLLCHRCQLPKAVHFEQSLRCQVCYERIIVGNICNICTQAPPLYSHSRFLWDYSNNPRDFCVALKYKPSLKLIDYAAETLSQEIPTLFPQTNWDIICPIPASKTGLKKRGFNHVEILARVLKTRSKLKARILSDIFKNSNSRKPQASLSNQGRLKGLRSRYQLKKQSEGLVQGKKVLLLDDVSTTGATIQAAALALMKSGASSIEILTLCRSPTWFVHRAEMPSGSL